jgi:hypothetical protein
MKTVTLQVPKLEEVKRRACDAFRGKKKGSRISFACAQRDATAGRQGSETRRSAFINEACTIS